MLCSCGHKSIDQPAPTYTAALTAFRNGGFADAYARARAAAGRCGSDLRCRWKFQLLEAESLFQLERDEEAAALLSQTPPGGSDFTALDLRRRMLLGYLLCFSRDKTKADAGPRLLDDAYRDAARLGIGELLSEMEIRKGRLVRDSQPETARALFLRASQHALQQHDEYNEAAALNDLGMLTLKKLARYDEAIPFLQQSLAAAKRVSAYPLVSAAYTNLALCYTQLGAYDRALELEKEALVWLGTGDSSVVRRHLLGETGRTFFLKGDTADAIAYYRQALDLSRNLKNDPDEDRRRWTSNIAAALSATGDWDLAEKANSEELALAHDDISRAYADLNTATIATGRKQFADAVTLYKRVSTVKTADPSLLWESYAGLARSYVSGGNKPLARSYFEKTIAIIDKNQTGLSRDEYKLTFLASLIRFYQDYVEFLMQSGDSEKALEIVESSRARILSEAIPQLKPGPRLSAAELQKAAQRSGRIFVSYWLAPAQSYAWVISSMRTQYFPLGPAAGIESLVAAFDQSLRGFDIVAKESPAARRLSDVLIRPVAPLIPRQARVVIVPDGALHYLNFETLPIYGEGPHYWIEDVTLVVAPSLAIAAAAPAEKAIRHNAALIIGDALSASQEYPPLAYASQEIGRVNAHLASPGTTIVRGAEATPASYRQANPRQFSIIHFSAHGEANSQIPLDSAIILSPRNGAFKLYARDVIDVPLDADLVTISACHSAGARVYSGEGLVGFVWAFLKAGARYVVAGLWDVTDSSTPDMMDQFYGAIERGQSPADALRSAKLSMIGSNTAFRKPYYWGPFQIYIR